MAKQNKLGRRQLKNLYADLREVFGLYDLEIVMDDGIWFWHDTYSDTCRIHVAPFSAHRAFEGNSGAKKGEWGTHGAGKIGIDATPENDNEDS